MKLIQKVKNECLITVSAKSEWTAVSRLLILRIN